jgi:hypothetical protein
MQCNPANGKNLLIDGTDEGRLRQLNVGDSFENAFKNSFSRRDRQAGRRERKENLMDMLFFANLAPFPCPNDFGQAGLRALRERKNIMYLFNFVLKKYTYILCHC